MTSDFDNSKEYYDWRHYWEDAEARKLQEDFLHSDPEGLAHASKAIAAMVQDQTKVMESKSGIDHTLDTREATHGSYKDNCVVTQKLEEVINTFSYGAGQGTLTEMDYETLHMIFHKIARAVNGNADFADHWHDIAGYATLREKACGQF